MRLKLKWTSHLISLGQSLENKDLLSNKLASKPEHDARYSRTKMDQKIPKNYQLLQVNRKKIATQQNQCLRKKWLQDNHHRCSLELQLGSEDLHHLDLGHIWVVVVVEDLHLITIDVLLEETQMVMKQLKTRINTNNITLAILLKIQVLCMEFLLCICNISPIQEIMVWFHPSQMSEVLRELQVKRCPLNKM